MHGHNCRVFPDNMQTSVVVEIAGVHGFSVGVAVYGLWMTDWVELRRVLWAPPTPGAWRRIGTVLPGVNDCEGSSMPGPADQPRAYNGFAGGFLDKLGMTMGISLNRLTPPTGSLRCSATPRPPSAAHRVAIDRGDQVARSNPGFRRNRVRQHHARGSPQPADPHAGRAVVRYARWRGQLSVAYRFVA